MHQKYGCPHQRIDYARGQLSAHSNPPTSSMIPIGNYSYGDIQGARTSTNSFWPRAEAPLWHSLSLIVVTPSALNEPAPFEILAAGGNGSSFRQDFRILTPPPYFKKRVKDRLGPLKTTGGAYCWAKDSDELLKPAAFCARYAL
jgi:hypothetical protein